MSHFQEGTFARVVSRVVGERETFMELLGPHWRMVAEGKRAYLRLTADWTGQGGMRATGGEPGGEKGGPGRAVETHIKGSWGGRNKSLKTGLPRKEWATAGRRRSFLLSDLMPPEVLILSHKVHALTNCSACFRM